MVTPGARREAVAHLREHHAVSERRACRVLGADRTAVRYRSMRPDDAATRARLRALAGERRRFGYRRLGLLLSREGVVMNHKKLRRRLYAEERLQVRRRGGRKRALGTRAPIAVPDGPNQRWSLDFVSDSLSDGRRFRVLCVVDDCTRECLGLVADTSLSGLRVARELDTIVAVRGLPLTVVSDNGTELTSTAILRWSQERGVGWHYIAPGKPQQNAYCRELQRAAAGRMPERDGVHVAAAGAGGAGGLARGLQPRPATLGAGGPRTRLAQRAAVLACIKAAARRLRRWPSASLDPGCARRLGKGWPGRRNGARPNRETPTRWAWRQPRTLLLSGGKKGLTSLNLRLSKTVHSSLAFTRCIGPSSRKVFYSIAEPRDRS